MNNNIRLAGIINESIVDGFGIRYVIFTQGCTHNCDGCHNKSTYSLDGGFLKNIGDIILEIKGDHMLDGVTLSGGEPFIQVDECILLVTELKKYNINIICYTGFLYEELLKCKKSLQLVNLFDYLIDGKFIIGQKDAYLPYRGSKNQRIIDVKESILNKKVISINNFGKSY